MEWVYRSIPGEKHRFEVGYWDVDVWHTDQALGYYVYHSPEWAANRAAELNRRQEPFAVVTEQPEY